MAKNGKKYRAVKEKAPTQPVALIEALTFLKDNPLASFDETVELAVRLGIDPQRSENAIRGTVGLPHGTGKSLSVVVFATGPAADAAREAGATEVGFEDLIEKVKGGWTDFDVAIATPEAMKEVRKLGRVLGPRGLMPNPKTGTVTDDPAKAVAESMAGRVEFRMDRQANVNVPVGKLSFTAEQLADNATSVLEALRHEKPAGAKGVYMRACAVSTTMGVGVKVVVSEV